jgi:opacity protein-like surface antigen
MKSFASLASIATFAACAATQAQSAGPARFYAGLDLGRAHYSRSADQAGFLEGSGGGGDLAWKARFGWQPSKYFALEASYADLGKFDAVEGTACASPADGPCPPSPLTTHIRAAGLAGIGIWPLGEHFRLQGSLGLLHRRTQSDFTLQGPWHPSDSDIAGLLGFGASYALTERIDVGLEWSRTYSLDYHQTADDRIVYNDGESRLLALGARWRF